MSLRLAPIALSTLSTSSRPFAPELSARLGRSASKRAIGGRGLGGPGEEIQRRYDALVSHWEALRETRRTTMESELSNCVDPPSFSVLLLSCDDPAQSETVRTVLSQTYPNLELILACPSEAQVSLPTPDERVTMVHVDATASEADLAASALAQARGHFIVPLLQGDTLDPDALLTFASTIADAPETLAVYADHDTVDEAGRRIDPNFKPDWNQELLYSCDYIARPLALRRSHAVASGGFRQQHDPVYGLVLRCLAGATPDAVKHVPLVLSHRDQGAETDRIQKLDGKNNVSSLSLALRETTGMGIDVGFDDRSGATIVSWPLPERPPSVSIIIPTRDALDLLDRAVTSILGKTDYPDYEILIVDNGSIEAATLDWLSKLSARDQRVRILRDDGPFNFSAINNRAAKQASGEILALVNNDVEVITPGWLREAVSLAVRKETGCVGAKLYYSDNTIQHAGIIVGMRRIAGHAFRGLPADADGYCGRLRMRQEVTAVTAACLVVRRDIFEEVGGLDEKLFPIAYNDVDFCLKVRAQ